MRLVDFQAFAPLNALRHGMGAELVEMPPTGWNAVGEQELLARLEKGIEVQASEIETLPDGTLEYHGQKVAVYIRDQRAHHGGQKREYKFHISWCDTLSTMHHEGRYMARYVVTRDTSGEFPVNIMEDGRPAVAKKIRLGVCKNCLIRLHYEGFSWNMFRRDRERIYSAFSLAHYLSKHDSHVMHLPLRTAASAPLNDYPADFRAISRKYRQAVLWRCERCGREFSKSPEQLQVHHISGDKSDNSPANLRALCRDCHAEQPGHGQMGRPSDGTTAGRRA